jgi:hypothetical protein
MSESVVVVCDVCGAVAEDGIIIRAAGRNFAKDLCGKHLREILAGTHTPKRGRRPGSTSKQTAVKSTTRKKSAAKRTAKRRTRAKAA